MSFGIFVFSDSKYINEGKISNRIFTCGFWISCFWKIRLAMHWPEKNTDCNYEKTILQRHLQLFLSRNFLFWPSATELCVFILRTGHKLVINRLNFWRVQKISSTINWVCEFQPIDMHRSVECLRHKSLSVRRGDIALVIKQIYCDNIFVFVRNHWVYTCTYVLRWKISPEISSPFNTLADKVMMYPISQYVFF